MQVKKFEAPTIQEALDNVKRELGPEAIILQTKTNKRGFGLLSKSSVEVTAAVSERSLQKKQKVENRVPDSNKDLLRKLSAERQANLLDKYSEKFPEKSVEGALSGAVGAGERVEFSAQGKKITATRYIDIQDTSESSASRKKGVQPETMVLRSPSVLMEKKSVPVSELEVEVKYLRKMIEELKKNQQEQAAESESSLSLQTRLDSPLLKEAFEQLVVGGIERRYAYLMIKKVAFDLDSDQSKNMEAVVDSLAHEMMQTIEVVSPLAFVPEVGQKSRSIPKLIAVVGPTGVGKTMSLAKLASEAAYKKNFKVGLINLDLDRVSSFEQLGTYAKILNLPFRSVSSIEDLSVALLDFQTIDFVMIDTPGYSQKDPDSLKKIQDALKTISGLQVYLVLSATTRDSELYDMAARFISFGPRGLIMSKLDESSIYGSIYNVSQRYKIPLAYFTTGKKIPDDIELASAERLAALLLNM